jgi:hypothetical protein
MPAFLVTYDLNKEISRPPIVKRIKAATGAWAKLSESSYAVGGNITATGLYNYLAPLLDGNDQLYVVQLSQPWTGRGNKAVNAWLSSWLGPAG